jgi:UDP-N-acetylglucosamine--N-acetylmuramyl-(pentapeptide) pyrophosphoryl-undecaprenol N-acetylglucosamine transferase
MGGSQGASGINHALIKSLPFLQGLRLQVIHLSGARDERLVSDNYRRENIPAYVGAFYHRMEEPYSAADVVVARAGAASLAEFAAFSLPGILIPFPYATHDHQTRNAEIYAHAEAAVLVKESELSGELLARTIRELIQHPERMQQMAANCSRLAPKDAAGRVANTMEKYTTHEAGV